MSHKVNKRGRLSAKRLIPKLLAAIFNGPTYFEYNSAVDASRAWLYVHDNVHFRRYYGSLAHPLTPEVLQRRLDRIIYLTQGGYIDDEDIDSRG